MYELIISSNSPWLFYISSITAIYRYWLNSFKVIISFHSIFPVYLSHLNRSLEHLLNIVVLALSCRSLKSFRKRILCHVLLNFFEIERSFPIPFLFQIDLGLDDQDGLLSLNFSNLTCILWHTLERCTDIGSATNYEYISVSVLFTTISGFFRVPFCVNDFQTVILSKNPFLHGVCLRKLPVVLEELILDKSKNERRLANSFVTD